MIYTCGLPLKVITRSNEKQTVLFFNHILASLTLQLRVRFEAILGALIAANPSIIESATNQEQLERDVSQFHIYSILINQ